MRLDFPEIIEALKTGKFCQNDILLSEIRDVVYLQSHSDREKNNFGDDKGLMIPCLLQFSGLQENIEFLKKLLLNSVNIEAWFFKEKSVLIAENQCSHLTISQ